MRNGYVVIYLTLKGTLDRHTYARTPACTHTGLVFLAYKSKYNTDKTTYLSELESCQIQRSLHKITTWRCDASLPKTRVNAIPLELAPIDDHAVLDYFFCFSELPSSLNLYRKPVI